MVPLESSPSNVNRCARDFLTARVPKLREGKSFGSLDDYRVYQQFWQNGSVHVSALQFPPSNIYDFKKNF